MATQIRPISIDIAFSDDGLKAKGAAVVEAVFVDGEFMRLLPAKPLAESSVDAVQSYATAFAASAIEQVATLTAARESTLQTVSDLQAMVASLMSQVDTIPSLNEQVAALTAERDELLTRVPPESGPREITPSGLIALFEEVAPQQLLKIWNNEDPIAAKACYTLFTWPPDKPIDRDSPTLQQLLLGLQHADLLSADQVKQIIGAE